MKASEISAPLPHQVIVVYFCRGGIPYVECVTRSTQVAKRSFEDVVRRHGRALTFEEAQGWLAENRAYPDELDRIENDYYLAHTDDFDAYVEVRPLD